MSNLEKLIEITGLLEINCKCISCSELFNSVVHKNTCPHCGHEHTLQEYAKGLNDVYPKRFAREYEAALEKLMWPAKVFVVAESYRHARWWARENNCPKKLFRYVEGVRSFAGQEGQVVFYERWYLRRDADEIKDYINVLISEKRLVERKA